MVRSRRFHRVAEAIRTCMNFADCTSVTNKRNAG